jgi:hypothetical protein
MKMKKRKIGFFSAIYGLVGMFLAAVCVCAALLNINASPILLRQPQAAMDQVTVMLDALCEGDYDAVSSCLYGSPNLGIDREAEDPVGRLFWEALAGSFTYELGSEFHATDSGVSLDIKVEALDISSVTANLRERARALMEAHIAEAEDTDDIYDENNEYREEFVMDSLYRAAQEALEQDATQTSWELTLNLVYENGQWWIMPEQALLRAISGGVLK